MNIAIIGGGAAGFFAAITCAESNPNAKVTILERGKDVLEKVKISGGGRCNVTHACFTAKELVKHYPRGERELMGPFSKFQCGDTIDWFEKRGVALKIEEDGRMFPTTDDSATIANCLYSSAIKAGVSVRTSTRVEQIVPPSGPNSSWKIHLASDRIIEADKIMFASGSNPRCWEMLAELGHTIIPPVPSLFTFNINDARIKGLEGISVTDAEVSIRWPQGLKAPKLMARGPVLVTHWGLSGPGILRLSAWGARALHELGHQFDCVLNFCPGYRPNEILEELQSLKLHIAKQQFSSHSQFGLPSRLWQRLVEAAKIPLELRWADASKAQLTALAAQLTEAQFMVNGKSTFKEEFVTAGGVALKEIEFKSFSSKIHPTLFMAGEVLDIDAITGGFNFQAAWTGGFLAGKALAGE